MLKLSPIQNNSVSDINQYIGKQIRCQRLKRGLTHRQLATCLGLDVLDIAQIEDGKMRLCASDLFLLKRKFDIPLSYFFSHEREYFSDIVLNETEMADIFHCFSNIEDTQTRNHLLKQIKLSSSVF